DAPVPNVSINDVSVTEGNSGTTHAVLTVSLSVASGLPVTMNWATADGTASARSEYAPGSGTLTVAPGVTTQTLTNEVNGDLANELDESFVVNLSNVANATIAKAQGVVTIVNDDGPPSLSINDVTVTEGNSGTTEAVLTVSLPVASAFPVTVNWATADGTASALSDYAPASGTLSFAPGVTSQTLTVKVNGDRLIESSETFIVNLSNALNAAIA